MWFFKAPEIVYGEDALSYLSQLQGQRAFIVTDAVLAKLGYPEMVIAQLKEAGIPAAVFSDVEPEPSLQTVRKGAAAMLEFEPDWIIGLGGGSAMDAAKAMW
ncbi:MAG: iron-containing alcohol dehydrogenase, partial [Anaerolineae bacterium]